MCNNTLVLNFDQEVEKDNKEQKETKKTKKANK